MNFFRALLLTFSVLTIFEKNIFSQKQSIFYKKEYYKAKKCYVEGNYKEALTILLPLVKNEKEIEKNTLFSVYNLIGIQYKKLMNYEKAVYYYNKNLKLFNTDKDNIKKAVSYMHIGNIYKNKGCYTKALENYEEASRIIKNETDTNKLRVRTLSEILYNSGIVYYNSKEYRKAISFYKKSLSFKKKYDLAGIGKIYFNLARGYDLINESENADSNFISAIRYDKDKFGKDYFRLAPLYMYYGNFLRKQKRFSEARINLIKAKELYEKNYGQHHPYTANSYVNLGKYYSDIDMRDSALYWFQKSLSTNSKTFVSNDFKDNPKLSETLGDFQLVTSLKYKADALLHKSLECDTPEQTKYLLTALKTIHEAVGAVSEILSDYTDEQNKLILTDEEKMCYSLAVEISYMLYEKTGNKTFEELAYYYASSGKAPVLSEKSEEELFIKQHVPDSIVAEMTEFEQNISSYKRLIHEEQEKISPDSSKIYLWKSVLFKLNKKKNLLYADIKKDFNLSHQKPEQIIPVTEIQDRLPEHTTLTEYFIKTEEESNIKDLYIFTINKKGFHSIKRRLSDSFDKNLQICTDQTSSKNVRSDLKEFNTFSAAAYDLYSELIVPVKKTFNGTKLIIIPDEKLSYLSFDALLSQQKEYGCINYSALPYLVFDYCFSYAYSTSLLFSEHTQNYGDSLYAFAPEYESDNINTMRSTLGRLNYNKKEINTALKYFKGEAYTGNNANISRFKSIVKNGGILHFAMHASVNPEHNEYSYLAFTDNSIKHKDRAECMYAYEIEQMKINSPLVVLSACKTGDGKLYSGEGVTSLARSFIKSGVPSVVYSLWDVNDDIGYKIMQLFYANLADGENKNESLQEAKITYLNEVSPTLANPSYWSGYVLSGNISPVKKEDESYKYIFAFMILLISGSVIWSLLN